MAKIVTLNIGASRAMLAEYVLKGKKGLVLSAYGAADIAGLDWEAEGSVEAVLAPALREAAKTAGIKPGPLYLALNGQMVFPRFSKLPPVTADKLELLVHSEVEQNVPFPIDEIESLTGTATSRRCIPISVPPISSPACARTCSTATGESNIAHAVVANEPPALG